MRTVKSSLAEFLFCFIDERDEDWTQAELMLRDEWRNNYHETNLLVVNALWIQYEEKR